MCFCMRSTKCELISSNELIGILALSQEQSRLFQDAIIREMRAISLEILLKSAPGTRKKTDRKIIPKLA